MEGDEFNERERKFKPNERVVLMMLEGTRRPLTTAKIARLANISWQAADNNLDGLWKEGLIHKRERRTRTYWWV